MATKQSQGGRHGLGLPRCARNDKVYYSRDLLRASAGPASAKTQTEHDGLWVGKGIKSEPCGIMKLQNSPGEDFAALGSV